MSPAQFLMARRSYHEELLRTTLSLDETGVATNAEAGSKPSREIARALYERLTASGRSGPRMPLGPQVLRRQFEAATARLINATFPALAHMRPGRWDVRRTTSRSSAAIAEDEQYPHLVALQRAVAESRVLVAALGSDDAITPDIVITRRPEPDERINERGELVDDSVTRLAPLRRRNSSQLIVHSSISCKYTIGTGRAQSSRAEPVNLMGPRKGPLPHLAVITAEPLPIRIASVALGTSDIDCVYHFALPELQDALDATDFEDARELLRIMVDQRKLRDVGDLPLDLVA